MKNTILILLACCIYGVGYAQVETDSTYLPKGGEHNFELNFAPLRDNPISVGTLRYRKFKSETKAIRAGLNFRQSGETLYEDRGIELKTKNNSGNTSLFYGTEYHFPATTRLSAYIGWEGFIGFHYSTHVEERILSMAIYKRRTSESGMNIGANVVTGFDFYITHNLYIGTEIGYRFGLTKDFTGKVTDTYPGISDRTIKGGWSYNIRPTYNSQIRLGWIF